MGSLNSRWAGWTDLPLIKQAHDADTIPPSPTREAMRRIIRPTLAVIALTLLASACSGSDEPSSTDVTTSSTTIGGSPATSLTATTTSTTPPSTEGVTIEATPTIEYGPCPFDEPAGTSPVCGTVTVPEDRSEPDGGTVVLAVAMFPPTSGNELQTPFVYLEGGPGGEILEAIPFAYPALIEPLNDDRIVVVFDQRGTGFTEPSLACPEINQLAFELLDNILETEELTRRRLDALAPCQARWADSGIDLSHYNSAASASDVDDIRRALDYPEWDLYGVSYGTRLALTVMRDHPEGIRSVVLDSTYPPEVDGVASIPGTADRALNELYVACAGEPACHDPYGDIEELLFAVIDSLNETPANISVTDLFTGTRHEAVLDGDTVLDLGLPEPLLRGSADRNPGDAGRSARRIVSQGRAAHFACGRQPGVLCDWPELLCSVPRGSGVFGSRRSRHGRWWSSLTSPHWSREHSPNLCTPSSFVKRGAPGSGNLSRRIPCSARIPTLVTAGQFDPITPPSFGRAVADRLENAYFVEYRGVGHGVAAIAGCPLSVTLAFLADPTVEPDTSCADSMSPARFTVYTGDTTVELVEVEVELFGTVVPALVPAASTDVGFGSFYRSTSGTDETALLIQPYSEESLVEVLVDAYGALLSDDGPLSEVAMVAIGGREWRRFTAEASELRMEVAIWSGEGSTSAVVIVSEARDADGFYTSVFLPALESIRLLP